MSRRNKKANKIVNVGPVIVGPMAKLLSVLPPPPMTKKIKKQFEEWAKSQAASQFQQVPDLTNEQAFDATIVQNATDAVIEEQVLAGAVEPAVLQEHTPVVETAPTEAVLQELLPQRHQEVVFSGVDKGVQAINNFFEGKADLPDILHTKV